jgi:FkbM family methyltransferase
MKQITLNFFRNLLSNNQKKKLLYKVADILGINLLNAAYNRIGILNYENYVESGEKYLVEVLLKKIFDKKKHITVFDVGGNDGTYAKMIATAFPYSQVYSFEPIPETQELFIKTNKNLNNIKLFKLALDENIGTKRINFDKKNPVSGHNSFYEDVFTIFLEKKEDLENIEIITNTIDNFCRENLVHELDFLKIDTEGNEYPILKGAKKMIEEKKIAVIQFEFGECNVFSKFFLKDFYDLLNDYSIYRLNSNHLIDLQEYNSTNEIFRFQNIIAIRKDITIE